MEKNVNAATRRRSGESPESLRNYDMKGDEKKMKKDEGEKINALAKELSLNQRFSTYPLLDPNDGRSRKEQWQDSTRTSNQGEGGNYVYCNEYNSKTGKYGRVLKIYPREKIKGQKIVDGKKTWDSYYKFNQLTETPKSPINIFRA